MRRNVFQCVKARDGDKKYVIKILTVSGLTQKIFEDSSIIINNLPMRKAERGGKFLEFKEDGYLK